MPPPPVRAEPERAAAAAISGHRGSWFKVRLPSQNFRPENTTLTRPSIALSELVEKGADTDLVREMIQHVVQRVMDMDVENLCAAAYGERSSDRQNSRNGYRERLWETRAGAVNVKIPKLRSGGYFPPFLEPRRTAEKALAAVIQKAYIQGVSTRSVDEPVHAFLDRPLEGDWPYLWIDATYVKSREAGRIVSKAVIIAVAVNTEGVRQVLGMAVGPSEAEPFWRDFQRSLTRRGLRGVKLVIFDAHEGLKAAAAKVLNASWQRCKVHFLRNALANAGKGQRQMVLAAINTAFAQDSFETATAQWRIVADQLRAKLPKLGELMDTAETEVLSFMAFPKAHRTQIHSTNPLERLNAEGKRRTDVVKSYCPCATSPVCGVNCFRQSNAV